MNPNEPPIGAVIFDFGGVISVPVFHDLEPIDDELGVPRGSLHRLLFGDIGDPNPDFHRLETGELSFLDYLSGLERRAPEILGQPLEADAFMRFSISRGLQIQWPVVHRIRELRAEGLPLGLLTNNAKEFAESWQASFPVTELFPVVIDSSVVGLRKPDPRIYELTCEHLDVEPDAAVFLDDNLENIESAKTLGIETILVTPDPMRTIQDLDEVLARSGRASST
jgi:epoxide hydrolase-like predicted phosphatase